MSKHPQVVSAAQARDEVREYIAQELGIEPESIQMRVAFNRELPWVDGKSRPCFLVEWAEPNGRDGVAIAGPYTYNFFELTRQEAYELGPVNAWRQHLLNLYAGCELVVQARLTQPLSDTPDPVRLSVIQNALQERTNWRIGVNIQLREFLRLGTQEYYIFDGHWLWNPNYRYSSVKGFIPIGDKTLFELPKLAYIPVTNVSPFEPIPAVGEDGAYPGQLTGFIAVKDNQILEINEPQPYIRLLYNKLALYYVLGQEHGPFQIEQQITR
ncbi:hypothetical protein HMJ29_17175 [Hymenobacter taeanensis]|uniref:Uncharacterized protein n=1 Tax=Hymenobacter taeanensis TaxID=2735321 RepID=A0A6M6BNB5_9BACT|nr:MULTISPECIES: hypothetical protein [Hymenobacter]QJX48555.1 hypothetical protein HMJ29_17175 [Hymenobacter taeanensis]UOQ81948.1 hypothetical protein MUN83_03935 [Hymenobacter sp. 5414T-23]